MKIKSREEILKDLNERFEGDIIDVFDKSPTRVYIEIKAESLVKIATYIFKELEARFNIASGTDMRHYMEILYHFSPVCQGSKFESFVKKKLP